MPQLSSGDSTVIQLRLNLTEGGYKNVLMGLCYMPYDSKDLPPPKEVKELVTHARSDGFEILLRTPTIKGGRAPTSARGGRLSTTLLWEPV